MVTSLSDLCAHLDAAASLVVQADRRQTGDRRRTRRGGRRADDLNPAVDVDALDLRAVAMRRAVASANGGSNVAVDDGSLHGSRYAVATGRRILE